MNSTNEVEVSTQAMSPEFSSICGLPMGGSNVGRRLAMSCFRRVLPMFRPCESETFLKSGRTKSARNKGSQTWLRAFRAAACTGSQTGENGGA